MSNKIVICYDLYEADNTLRDKVVKILKENNYTKVKNIDTLWEKELSNSEKVALEEFDRFRKNIKSELEDLIYPFSNEVKKFTDLYFKISQPNRSKLNIKFYLSIKDEEENI